MRFASLVLALGLSVIGCAANADEDSASTSADLASSSTCGLDALAPSSPRQLLDKPITSTAEAAQRIGCLQEILHAQHDGRAPFATLYLDITNSIDAAIANGTFEDGPWAQRYLTAFAELYRTALVNHMDGKMDQVPGAWRAMLDAAQKPKTLVVQDLALAVNAHVNHDLAHALYTIGIGSGDTRAMHQRDHFRVNAILHSRVQASLETFSTEYAPGMGEVPSKVMDLLTGAYFMSLEAGRLKAWYDGVALTDAASLLKKGVDAEIEGSSKLLADAILVPSIDPAIAAKLHALEEAQ